MEYTQLFLFGMGCLGILIHNLIKMDKLNRKEGGNFKLRQYLLVERFSILISIAIVLGATLGAHEIQGLEIAGKWLGLGFIALGYMAQSIFVSIMDKAGKAIKKEGE